MLLKNFKQHYLKQFCLFVCFSEKGGLKMGKRWCELTNFTEIFEFNKISSKYDDYIVNFSHILTPILTVWWRRVTKILLSHFRPGGGALTCKGGTAYLRPSRHPFHACPTVHKTRPPVESQHIRSQNPHLKEKCDIVIFPQSKHVFLENRPMTIFSSRSSNLTATDFCQRD